MSARGRREYTAGPRAEPEVSLPRRLDSLERLALCDLERRQILGLGRPESALETLHRAGDELGLAIAPVPLERDVDEPAAVRQEVRYVKNAALGEHARDVAARQRIVRGPSYHLAIDRARERLDRLPGDRKS